MRPQLILDLAEKLIVVNFAGGGGTSTGIFMATGRHANYAINHNRDALGMHMINHPQTEHLCEDVWQVNPRELCRGRAVGLAAFSPDCTDFSKAKGGKPVSKKIRGLAWVAVKWAGMVRPDVIILENVEEFRTWGPLIAMRCKVTGRVIKLDDTVAAPDERVPVQQQKLVRDPRHLGRIFRCFVRRLRELGYAVEWCERRACNAGAGTIRKRFHLIARCDGQPIVWPEPTHGPAKSEAVKKKLLKPFVTAADSIDWSLPCPSIFLSPDEARKLRVKRPLKPASNRRLAKGVKRFVMDADEPFLVRVGHGDVSPCGNVKRWGSGVHSIDEALGAVTGSNEFGVVVPHVTKFRTGAIGSEAREPLHAITANSHKPETNPGGASPLGLVAASIAVNTTGHSGAAVHSPVPTIPSGGHHILVEASLAGGFITEHANGSHDRTMPLEEPLRTQCAEVKGGHFAVAGTLLARQFGTGIGHGPDQPLATIMPDGGGKTQLGAAFLAQQNTGVVGHPATAPVSTLTGTCSHQTLVAASVVQYYGSDQAATLDKPAPTSTTKDRTGLGECWLHIPPLTAELAVKARQVAAFLREHGIEFEGEFATTRSGLIIYDIGLRMLQPRELFNAQGFPPSYVIDEALFREPDGTLTRKKLPKHTQVRFCGNSVCPPEEAALVAANCPDLIIWTEQERAA